MVKDNRIIIGNSFFYFFYVLLLRFEKLFGLVNFLEFGLCFCNEFI